MNEHKQATPDHPLQEWIARLWSPYAFADRSVADDDLRCNAAAVRDLGMASGNLCLEAVARGLCVH